MGKIKPMIIDELIEKYVRPKFRVREVEMGDGATKYYAQIRYLFKWKPLKASANDFSSDSEFRNIEDANKYILKFVNRRKSKKVKKITNHKFNEVFERLKEK